MVDKKSKKTIEKLPTEEKSKRMGYMLGRMILVLFLALLNAGLWSWIVFKIQVLHEEHLTMERVIEKQKMERYFQEQLRSRQEAEWQEKQRLEAEKAAQKKVLPPDTVAVVNEEPITMAQMQQMVAAVPQLAEVPFETVYPNLLEMLINNMVIMQGATQAGVLERPEIKHQLTTVKEQIVGQTYLDELLSSKVTEDEIKAFYDKEVKNFVREEEIHARHILLKTEQEAKDVLIQLKAGAKFSEVADKKSLDESAEGGDLGYFTKGMMIPEFGDVVFDMKKGQLSDPIKTPFGWHVVLVEDKRLASPPALEEVYDDLKKAVMESKLPAVMEQERNRMKVQVLVPSLTKEEPEVEVPAATQEKEPIKVEAELVEE